jgi:hypothetical protein
MTTETYTTPCELSEGMKDVGLIPSNMIELIGSSSSVDVIRGTSEDFIYVKDIRKFRIIVDFTHATQLPYIEKVR